MVFRVVIAELATGIVCNPDGSRHVSGGPVPAVQFATLSEAESYSRERTATMPGYECAIYDGDTFLTIHRPGATGTP